MLTVIKLSKHLSGRVPDVAAVLLLLFRCNIVNLKSCIKATVLINATQFGDDLLYWITLRFCLNIERLMVHFVVLFNWLLNE